MNLEEPVPLHELAVNLGLNPRVAQRRARAGLIPSFRRGRDRFVTPEVAKRLTAWAAVRNRWSRWPKFDTE